MAPTTGRRQRFGVVAWLPCSSRAVGRFCVPTSPPFLRPGAETISGREFKDEDELPARPPAQRGGTAFPPPRSLQRSRMWAAIQLRSATRHEDTAGDGSPTQSNHLRDCREHPGTNRERLPDSRTLARQSLPIVPRISTGWQDGSGESFSLTKPRMAADTRDIRGKTLFRGRGPWFCTQRPRPSGLSAPGPREPAPVYFS